MSKLAVVHPTNRFWSHFATATASHDCRYNAAPTPTRKASVFLAEAAWCDGAPNRSATTPRVRVEEKVFMCSRCALSLRVSRSRLNSATVDKRSTCAHELARSLAQGQLLLGNCGVCTWRQRHITEADLAAKQSVGLRARAVHAYDLVHVCSSPKDITASSFKQKHARGNAVPSPLRETRFLGQIQHVRVVDHASQARDTKFVVSGSKFFLLVKIAISVVLPCQEREKRAYNERRSVFKNQRSNRRRRFTARSVRALWPAVASAAACCSSAKLCQACCSAPSAASNTSVSSV